MDQKQRQLKVVIAVHHFPPQYTSGAELRAYRTAAWLQAQGHDVRVVCVESIDQGDGRGLSFVDDVYDGLAVRRLSFDLAGAPDPFRWSYDNPWIGEHLRDYLAELAPDLLHLISGYLLSGSVLNTAADLQIPTVLTLTDFWFLCPRITLLRSNGQLCAPPLEAATCARCLGEERRRYRLPGKIAPALANVFWQNKKGHIARLEARKTFLRATLNHTNAIISPSCFLRDIFIEAGVTAERITFSRQGRDFPGLTSSLLTKTPAAYLRVGYMGQIAPHKGVHTLFNAARQLPSAALGVKIFGDTHAFPDYARQLRELERQDTRVRLAGVYERTQVSRVLRNLDVVVVPSVWYENSPNTILEALAHHTPLIVSDLGGMAELVQDGVNGLLFAPGDASSLAARLQQLLEEPELLSRLRAGIQPVKSVAAEMAELQHVYEAALGGQMPGLEEGTP